MKTISPDVYAEAFVKTLAGRHVSETVIERFIASIRKHNDWARRNNIIRACEKKMRQRDGKELITIESARELSLAQREKLSLAWKGKNQDIEYRINPSLIAGVKIVIDEEKQFDGSLRRKLDKMFSEK